MVEIRPVMKSPGYEQHRMNPGYQPDPLGADPGTGTLSLVVAE